MHTGRGHMQSTKQVIFKLGKEEFSMDIMDVSIIEKYVRVEPFAQSPKNIKGIIRLRGEVIPVYSLRRKFGMEDIEPDDETRFLITKSNGITTAYEVDRMVEIVQVEPNNINQVPSIITGKDTSYIRYVINLDNRLIVSINHDSIMSDEEQNKIETLLKTI